MARRDLRRSSLPVTVRHLLLSGPQPTTEGLRRATSPIPVRGGDSELDPPRPLQSPGTLPPIASTPEPEQDTRDYSAGLSMLHGLPGPSSIPHGQTRRAPIYSDPSFYASSSRSTRHRTTYPLPSLHLSLSPLRPRDEGVARTSSLEPIYQTLARPYSSPQAEWDRHRFQEEPQTEENEEAPTLPAFEHTTGAQAPQPYPFPPSLGHVFSSEDSLIPRRRSETDVPTYKLRPLKGNEDTVSSVKSGKRRRDSDDEDDGKRKTKVPRKIIVACDFCRGRKLRCDGNKPTCWNCVSRKKLCIYQPHPRRRGPGKAPKGTRSKKRDEGHFPSMDTFNPQIVGPERRRQGTIDTLPPYVGEETPPPYLLTAESSSLRLQGSSSQAGPSTVILQDREPVTEEPSQTYCDEDDEFGHEE